MNLQVWKKMPRHISSVRYSPWEAVGSSQHKIRRNQDSSADVGTSEVEWQLPRPLTRLSYAAPYDPGRRLLPTAVWEQETLWDTVWYQRNSEKIFCTKWIYNIIFLWNQMVRMIILCYCLYKHQFSKLFIHMRNFAYFSHVDYIKGWCTPLKKHQSQRIREWW